MGIPFHVSSGTPDGNKPNKSGVSVGGTGVEVGVNVGGCVSVGMGVAVSVGVAVGAGANVEQDTTNRERTKSGTIFLIIRFPPAS